MNDIAISVIVPIFNAAKHIPHLVESITSQTFTNWELILIDDGSKDDSLSICQSAAINDERIIVLHQENRGPSAARNLGIKEARGAWITFIDADDDVLDCFLESMYALCERSLSVDLVFAGYLIVEKLKQSVFSYHTSLSIGREEVRDAIAKTNILHRCSPWGKLFRKSIIDEHDLLFDIDLSHSEDRLFVYNYITHIQGMATTSVIGYFYDSTSETSLKNKKLPMHMLQHRQKKLTEAARMLIDSFRLTGDDALMVVKHLFGLLSSAIGGIFYNLGEGKETEIQQQLFFDQYGDKELLQMMGSSKKWIAFLEQNSQLQLVLDQDFKTLNSLLAKYERNTKISRTIKKLLHQKETKLDFSQTITKLNNRK